jgi:hypothetical protein
MRSPIEGLAWRHVDSSSLFNTKHPQRYAPPKYYLEYTTLAVLPLCILVNQILYANIVRSFGSYSWYGQGS